MTKRTITNKILSKLKFPAANSKKGDNGRVFIYAGSNKYPGAARYAIQTASRLADLIYFYSVPENKILLKNIKPEAEFISIGDREAVKYASMSDVILAGPGLGIGSKQKKIVNGLLKKFPDKKFVLDADGLKMADKKLLNPNCVLTPHCREFKILFKAEAGLKNAKAMSKKYGCIILLKGKNDLICAQGTCLVNKTGNAGLTKGGTGDVLAGLVAGLLAKNSPVTAAAAGAYLNGLAGDNLFKKQGFFYNASDLIGELGRIFGRLSNEKKS